MLATALLFLAAAAPVPQSDQAADLFRPSTQAATLPLDQPGAVRERIVELDLHLLDGAASARRLDLELFDGARVTSERTSVESAYGGGSVWIGAIPGDEFGLVVISRVGESVHASIRSGGSLFKVAPAGAGIHRLTAIDESLAPACGTGPDQEVVSPPQAEERGGGTQRSASGPRAVDTMVLYTPQARNGAGGTNGILSLINLAISETNIGMATSDVDQRHRLAHVFETTYADSGDMGQDLSRLRSTNDSYMSNVHTLRTQYGADLVALIVNGGQYCGIAYLMTNVSQGFASSAFSVTLRSCATGNYTFGHEMGHNMGSAHDRQNASQGAYGYSFGYRTPNSAWRSIMAYSPGTRVLKWSNPNLTVGGYAFGTANDDNHRSLNTAAPTFSTFRAETPPVLAVDSLVAGSNASISLSGCSPLGATYLAYSLAGGGPTNSAFGIVDLTPPIRTVSLSATPAGVVSWSPPVPAGATGRPVWFQGVDVCSATLSNSIAAVVQ
ncbi:MAG TPA: M12 family metallo-peptidase [Planctomycetota bacterium]